MYLEPNFIEFYQYEERAICYELYTEHEKFNPDENGVSVKVYNKNNKLIAEKPALLIENRMCFLVEEEISKNPGEYIIIWQIKRHESVIDKTETFNKKTKLVIRKL